MPSNKALIGASVLTIALVGALPACSNQEDTAQSTNPSESTVATSSNAASSSSETPAEELTVDASSVGKILKKEQLNSDEIISAPNGSETLRVSYGSKNAKGDPILATGLVTLPKGEAPEGGWPVLSWAHGTTGIAAKCAPSLAIKTHPDEEALVMVAQKYLQTWLDKGFAVIQPDYEGLGTTGNGTYMDRHSLASAVNEMVRATREEFKLNEKWYNTGWSQGGFAAVSAASAEDVPSGLVKTMAIAPGDTQVPATEITSDAAHKKAAAIDPQSLTYAAYSVQGSMNFDPKVKRSDFLSEKGEQVADMALQECLTTFKKENTISGKEFLNENPKLEAIQRHLIDNSMINMTPKTPVIIFISEDDDIIDYAQISDSAKKLSENEGTDVKIEVRKGKGHRDMVRSAIQDQTPYVPELQK